MGERKRCELPVDDDVCGEPATGEIAGVWFCAEHYDVFMKMHQRLKNEYGDESADETIGHVVRDIVGAEDAPWYDNDWPEDDDEDQDHIPQEPENER